MALLQFILTQKTKNNQLTNEHMNKSKICLITGGTGGIGYHLSIGFLNAGYKVIALDVQQHKSLPESIVFKLLDLADENNIIRVFKEIIEEIGQPNILINNAGIAHFNKPITAITSAEFDHILDIDLRGAFLTCREFIKANKNVSYGRIINIASTRWNQNEANWEAYGAAKGGLVSLTNSLCVSLSDTAITANAISPGWIATKDYDQLTETDHQQHPSGRVGIPRDILNACLFLAHEENDFINGVNLVVDGGMTKRMIYF